MRSSLRFGRDRSVHPPGPRLPRAAQTIWMRSRPLEFLERTREQHGDRFTFHALAHPPLVFLADPREAGEVFAAPVDVLAPGEGGAAIMPIVGQGSFMLADAEVHRRGRARLASAYTATATAQHAAMVRELAEREVAGWPRGVPIALHERLRALTLRVILTTLFGAQLEQEPTLLPRLMAMLSIASGTALTIAATRRVPNLGGRWRRFLHDRDTVDGILHRLIEARRQHRGAGEEPADPDVLDLLVAARDEHGEPLGDVYVRDTLMSLILAGHETTAAELAWGLQLLAHDPRAQSELASAIRREERPAYLTATVQEVLRHRPVFLFAIPRAVKQPIRIGDWTHAPPAHLLVCLYLLHHDPRLFPDPHRFWPERFLQAPPGAGWLPWGGGRKRCPGHRLATLELETVLRTVLAECVLEPAGRVVERARWRSVIVAPGEGCRVVLRARRAGV